MTAPKKKAEPEVEAEEAAVEEEATEAPVELVPGVVPGEWTEANYLESQGGQEWLASADEREAAVQAQTEAENASIEE